MKNWIAALFVIFIPLNFAMGKEPPIYTCRIENEYLKQQKSSAEFQLLSLDQAEFKFKTSEETFRCPVEVEMVQDGTRFEIAQITVKMNSAKCNSATTDINKIFRKRIILRISSQPGMENDAKITWKIGEAVNDCRVLENNLKAHGLGILRNSKGSGNQHRGNQ